MFFNFATSSYTNQAVQLKMIAGGLNILDIEMGLYCLLGDNVSADLRILFLHMKKWGAFCF